MAKPDQAINNDWGNGTLLHALLRMFREGHLSTILT